MDELAAIRAAEAASNGPEAGPRTDRLLGQVRPFWKGFGLTVVTLGLYPLFWHPIVNGEVARQVRLPSSGNGFWGLLVAFGLIGGLVLLITAWPALKAGATADTLGDDPLFWGFGVAIEVFFLLFVALQVRNLRRGFRVFGVERRPPLALFCLLHALGWAMGQADMVFLFFASILLTMAAYFVLQSEYNDFWHHVRRNVHAATPADDLFPADDEPLHMPT